MNELNAPAFAVFSRNLTRRRLPVGRFTVAIGGTQKRAQRVGSDRVVALCIAALTAAGRYVDLRRRRKARRDARGGGRAMAADKRVDAGVRSIHKHLTSCVETYEGTEKASEAQRLLDEYFPEGLGAIISAPYEEELVMAEHLAEAFSGPEAALVDALGARMFVDALLAVLPEYRDALDLEDIVTATEVAEARDAMHLLLLRAVATILADHADDVDGMRQLLAPIEDQEKRLADLYSARRRGQSTGALDVMTGEAVDAAREAEAGALADGLLADDEDEAAFDAEEAADDAVDVAADLEGEAPEADPPGLRPLPRG